MRYKFFNACFKIYSTLASGSILTILATTFSTCFLEYPSVSNADNASVRLVLFENVKFSEEDATSFTLSFRSTITRCAVFAPIPFAA